MLMALTNRPNYTVMYRLLMALSLVWLVTACGGGQQNNQAETEQSENDVLMNKVLDKHDVAMARMGEIYNLKKQVLARVDSLVAAGGDESAVNELRNIAQNLESADKGMMNWMRDFSNTWDPYKNGEKSDADTKAYYEDQQALVDKVNDDINNSIAAATKALQ